MPYANPIKTAKCLDSRRLNKQMIEVIQIISANTGIYVGWKIPKYIKNHPVTKMWENYENYLINYLDWLLSEYGHRTNKLHKCYIIFLDIKEWYIENYGLSGYYDFTYIKHLTPEFCKFHQKKLYNKNPEYYKQFKGV